MLIQESEDFEDNSDEISMDMLKEGNEQSLEMLLNEALKDRTPFSLSKKHSSATLSSSSFFRVKEMRNKEVNAKQSNSFNNKRKLKEVQKCKKQNSVENKRDPEFFKTQKTSARSTTKKTIKLRKTEKNQSVTE